ncbi:hypothetical protein CVT25_012107 [Psilocybe cyanescens]|uniref:Uncharacterized protein n=1 Tax=Psilocybe cyanescens TaxID=93625 RepID=A0A409VR80_PSICY|nr:hypothetical protein CVT25_012107 [Psilocybe cyanescens]
MRADSYGFNDSKCRFIQLRRVLQLDGKKTSKFNAIKNELKSIANMYLDPDGFKAQYQHRALSLIEQELLNRHPQIYGGEDSLKKLYFARRAVLEIDRRRRKRENERIMAQSGISNSKTLVEQVPERDFIDLTLESASELGSEVGKETFAGTDISTTGFQEAIPAQVPHHQQVEMPLIGSVVEVSSEKISNTTVGPSPSPDCETNSNVPTVRVKQELTDDVMINDTALGLERTDERSNRVLGSIGELARKSLDITLTTGKQRHKLVFIENELKRQHPDIFNSEESEKRLYIATRVVISMHTARRQATGHAVHRKQKGKAVHETETKTQMQSDPVNVTAEILGLKTRGYEDLPPRENVYSIQTDTTNKIGKEYLCIEHTPSSQPEALKAIREELIKRHPEVFKDQDAEKRLYLAERMITRHHLAARHVQRRKAEKRRTDISNSIKRKQTPGRKCKRPQKSVSQTAPSTPEAENKNISKIPSTENSGHHRYWDLLVPTRFSSELVQSVTSSEPAPKFRRREFPTTPPQRTTTPRRTVTPSCSAHTSSPTTLIASRTPSGGSATTSSTTMLDAGHGTMTPDTPSHRHTADPGSLPYRFAYEAVYQFLDACSPSMAHLWCDFIAYGCDDEEMLLAVSFWPSEYTNAFLHRVADKSLEPMTEMDIEILQTHFLTYFKE